MRPILLDFGIVPFHSIYQRPQHMAAELARKYEVVYVEPHRSAARNLLAPEDPLPATVPPGIHLLRSASVLPLSGYLPALNRINYGMTARRVRRLLAARSLGEPGAILVSFPKQVDALRHFDGIPVVYDVMDDYSQFFDRWQGAVLERMHLWLLRSASRVVVSSRALAERCRPHARSIACIGNGVGRAFLEACASADPDPEVAALPRPRLGYVGTLDRWFDHEIVRRLAETIPSASIVLVGPRSASFPALPPSVRLLPPRPHARIPALLRALDLGIIPFERSRLTDAVNPVKLYEYLAAGLPVATSEWEEILSFTPWVTVCRTLADWQRAATLASLEPRDDPERERRRAFAAQHLWESKALQLDREIETAIEEAARR